MARQKASTEEPKKLRAVIYVRISLDRVEETSIANQIRECEDYCRAHNIEIVGEPFPDRGRSAFKVHVDRPQFDAAMQTIESGAANHLLVWKLDRMTRNAVGFMEIHNRLEKAGATFGSVMDPYLDTSDKFGLAIVFLMATIAEMETENIQGRMLSWHEGRRGNNAVPIGPRPYGYRRPQKGDDDWKDGGQLFVIPEEKAIILELADRIIAGEQLRSLARELTARGEPTPRGKSAEWNHATIRKILLSPTIAGQYSDGTQADADSWEPILSPERATEVRTTLRDPIRAETFGASRIPSHVLTNIMRCGREGCGAEMNTFIGNKGRRYRCKGCNMSVNADTAETVLNEWVHSNITDARWRAMKAAGRGRDTELIEELERRIEELTIDYYSRSGKRNAISHETYTRLNDELMAELESAEGKPMLKLPEVASLRGNWEGMSVPDKRLVIHAAVDSITVAPLPQGAQPSPENARKRVSVVGR